MAEDKRANLAKTTLGKDESRERTGKLKTEVEAEGHAFSSGICNKNKISVRKLGVKQNNDMYNGNRSIYPEV